MVRKSRRVVMSSSRFRGMSGRRRVGQMVASRSPSVKATGWHDPVSDHWFQQTWFSGTKPAFRDIGVLGRLTGGLRSYIDANTAKFQAESTGRAGGRGARLEVGQAALAAVGEGPRGGGRGGARGGGRLGARASTRSATPLRSAAAPSRDASAAKAASWQQQIDELVGGGGGEGEGE